MAETVMLQGANVTKVVYLKLYFHDLGTFAVDKWQKLILIDLDGLSNQEKRFRYIFVDS